MYAFAPVTAVIDKPTLVPESGYARNVGADNVMGGEVLTGNFVPSAEVK